MTKSKRRGAGEGLLRLRADKRWEGRISLGWEGGKRISKSYFGTTQAEVQNKLLKARTDLAAGLPLKVEKHTVGSFFQRWLRDAVAPSVRALTLEQYQQHVRLYLTPTFGHLPLQKLHPADIQRFIAARLAAGLSARTVRISLFVLSRVCGQAVKWNLITRNPVDAVDLPKVERQPVKTFSDTQARALLVVVRGSHFESAYLLALLCGLRRGELLALAWEHLDLQTGTLSIQRSLERVGGRLEFVEPKSRSGRRTLPLPQPLLKKLKAHHVRQNIERLALGSSYEDNGLIFPNGIGRPLEPRAFNRRFKTALAQAGLPLTLRLHDCRHFAATAMIADGTDVRTVAGLLGHADPSLTVRTYAHLVPEAARRATDRMGALIDVEEGEPKVKVGRF
jgi:integrase